MNAKELAEALGVHPETIRRRIRNGEIKATQQGRELIIPKEEVKNLLHSKEVSDRHKRVVKSFYTVREQIETLQVSELSKLLVELENLQDWVKMKHMKLRQSEEEYLDFYEFLFDSWKKGRFSELTSIIEKLRDYDELIRWNEEVKDFSEGYSDYQKVHDLTRKVRDDEEF